MTSLDAYTELALAAVVLAGVVLVSFHLLHTYRMRRLREVRQGGAMPGQARDRAYNRLALARREADLLEAQGGDVSSARQLIQLADSSLRGGHPDRAYELAQSAHETLVKFHRDSPPSGAASGPAVPSSAAGGAGGGATALSTPATPTPVAKNRAEAQFQLHLFEQELAAAVKGTGASGPEAGEARTLYVQAHEAFARGEFGEAFRLALRGRRRLGAKVETLAPPGPGAETASGDPATAPGDLASAAEAVAARERCPNCGHPTLASDAFCRGCGAARTPTVCGRCGASRTPADAFCGRCGFRYDRPTAT